MKKAVISILGTVGHTQRVPYIDNNEIKYRCEVKNEDQKASYYFAKGLDFKLKKDRFFNMLPLMIENFTQYTHVPIYTKLSLKIQQSLLDFEKIEFDIKKNGLFVSEDIKDIESDYSYFLNGINKIVENYANVIIDLTHGFRHLPILAIINLIIQNIKNPEKIEYIFFAKEIEQYKEYEIIDLREYLELAQLSFVLSGFNNNYTVGNKMYFTNKNYQTLVDKLRLVSTHILGNSLKKLIGKNSITQETILMIKELEKDKKLKTFKSYTDEIISHLQRIKNLDTEDEYIQLYKLSQMMNERGYLLNSITLLNEAIGFYCVKILEEIDNSIIEHIKVFKSKIESAKTDDETKKWNLYKLSNHSKNIIKQEKDFNGAYLFNENEKEVENKSEIKFLILNTLEKKDNKILIDLIEKIENLRNNLAHGNSSDKIENVKGKISILLKEYQKIIKIPNEINIEEKIKEIEKKQENSKPKKQPKPKPTGINASKEKIDNLKKFLNDR